MAASATIAGGARSSTPFGLRGARVGRYDPRHLMILSGVPEPSVGAYVGYYAGFCLRYFVVMGLVFWFFHRAYRQRYLLHRIQAAFPERPKIAHEIRWSLVSGAATGVTTMLLFHLIRGGHTSMYLDVGEHGWPYLLFTVIFGIVAYDTYNYWQHRLLHTPWLFHHVHAVHHRVENPTVFAAFARHPAEALMEHGLFFFTFVVLVPVHPLAMAAIVGFFLTVGIIGHLGYELYPDGFTRHRLWGWFNTATHHNMHHSSSSGCNYGTWFNYWDRLMGTNHPEYHATFDAVATRRAGLAPVRTTPDGARGLRKSPERVAGEYRERVHPSVVE